MRKNPERRKNTKIAIVVICLFLVLGVLLSGKALNFLGNETDKPLVKLNDYVITSLSGHDGTGTLSMDIDYQKILKDYKDYIDYEGYKKMPSWVTYAGEEENSTMSCINVLLYGVRAGDTIQSKTFGIVLSQDNHLQNGDIVKVQFTNSPSKEEVLGDLIKVKFVYTDFDYEVKGLN